MILSKMRGFMVSSIKRHGTSYTSSGDTFNAILMKADVNQDMPRLDYTILAGYNATLHNGRMIAGDGRHHIPLRIDEPSVVDTSTYRRVYMKLANASGAFKRYVEQSNASTDKWDQPSGVEGTDYGWVDQATNVWISMEPRTMGDKKTDIGQQEHTPVDGYIPMSVLGDYIPAAGDRFVDQDDREWRVEDVDGFSYDQQAYKVKLSSDER